MNFHGVWKREYVSLSVPWTELKLRLGTPMAFLAWRVQRKIARAFMNQHSELKNQLEVLYAGN
jgi:hypothetical protein